MVKQNEVIILDPSALKPVEQRTGTQDMKYQLMVVNEKIDLFNECWPQLVEHAVAFELPLYESDPVSNKPIIPELIKPKSIYTGNEAVMKMVGAIKQFDVGDKVQNKTIVYRLPSVAILSSLEPVIGMIRAINQEKDILQAMMAEHPPGSRRKVARETCPGKVMLQIYRHIHTFEFEVVKLMFSWTTQAATYKSLDLKKAMDYVHSKRDNLSPKLDDVTKDAIVQAVINKLIQSGGDRFKIRRHISPTPRLKAFPVDCDLVGKLDAETLINSNIPAFVGGTKDPNKKGTILIPQVKPLVQVVPGAAKERQKRSKLTQIEPALDLFRVED